MRNTSSTAISGEIAALFQRDLKRLLQQVQTFSDEDLIWRCPPGITNSAGNLALHLEGNLRDYVGRLMGGVPYQRVRDQEFAGKGVAIAEIAARIADIGQTIPDVIGKLSDHQMQAVFPESPLPGTISTQHFLIHLHGHLNYHLGQIDYLRRILTSGAAVDYSHS
jgi:uncharacterized damage-inducible protein DinB